MIKDREVQPFLDWFHIQAGYVGFEQKGGKYFRKQYNIPSGIKLVSQKAIKSEPWLKADKPWEEICLGGYLTAIYENGRYRLWYEAYASDYKNDLDTRLCYTESKDGYTWIKPNLNLIIFRDNKKNNIVYDKNIKGCFGYHGGTVFKDFDAPLKERYKLIYMSADFKMEGLKKYQVRGAVSQDGIYWKPLKRPLIDNYFSDTQTIAYWDKILKSYVGYFRGWINGRRVISRAITRNFKKWQNPEVILSLGINSLPSHDLYTNAHTLYPGRDDLHLMFPSQYNREKDTVEVYLATSRDGIRWEYFGEKPIIPLDKKDGSIYAGCGLIPLEKDIVVLPYCVYPFTHNTPYFLNFEKKSYIGKYCWAMWKKDRFVALECEEEGRFTLNPLINNSDNFILNFTTEQTEPGEIKVQLEDRKCKPIKGFTFSDCDLINGDSLDKRVTWLNGKGIGTIKNKEIQIQIYMRKAKIYSFKFL